MTKLSADGKTQTYSTFISGVAGRALAVDAQGSVYLTGETGGVLPGNSSAQADLGGSFDAFVIKLTPDGRSVVYATYLGGGDLELGRGIAVDAEGSAYVVGWTTSTNFPVTLGAAQSEIGGGYDAFVAKLNPDGTRFVFATYLGGAGFESGAALALDSQRRVLVVGRTSSTQFASATQPTRIGSDKHSFDAYVARLSADGGSVNYLTILAGEDYDAAANVAVDASGAPVIMGYTESAALPVTPGVWQPGFGGERDLFVAKLTPAGDGLAFCTYLGTSAYETANDYQYAGGFTVGGQFISDIGLITEAGGLALDAAGNILVAGATSADSWPGTRAVGHGGYEAVVAKLSATGDRLLWLNLVGGRGDDLATSLASDGQGGAWVIGLADRPFFQPYFPTTGDAVQPGFGGGVNDAFLTHLNVSGAAPANDEFAGRRPIVGAHVTTVASNVGATRQLDEPRHAGNNGGASLWWTWTPPANGRVTVDTQGSNFDTLLAAYTGDRVSTLELVAANDDAPETTSSRVRFPVIAGRTYVLALDGHDGATGDVTLNLTFSQPPNDDFADRTVLHDFPVLAAGSNVNASIEGRSDGSQAGIPGGQRVWWEWTSPINGIVAISTSGSSFNTTLGVFTGTTLDSLTEIQSNDNYSNQPGADQTSQVTFSAAAGTAYAIAVDGYFSESGTIRLSIFPGTPPANDNFANRFPLSGFFDKGTASNVNATTETAAGEKPLTFLNASGQFDNNSAGYSVWWTWTAPTNGQVTLFTTDTTFDTRLGVFTGASVDQLQLVAANDNRGGVPVDYTSLVRFPVTTGTAYQIEVDGNVYGGHSGGYTLNLRLERPPLILVGTTTVTAEGAVQFQVQGLPGQSYLVERTANLKSWTAVTTLTPDGEFFTVTDPAAVNEVLRCYRVTQVP